MATYHARAGNFVCSLRVDLISFLGHFAYPPRAVAASPLPEEWTYLVLNVSMRPATIEHLELTIFSHLPCLLIPPHVRAVGFVQEILSALSNILKTF